MQWGLMEDNEERILRQRKSGKRNLRLNQAEMCNCCISASFKLRLCLLFCLNEIFPFRFCYAHTMRL